MGKRKVFRNVDTFEPNGGSLAITASLSLTRWGRAGREGQSKEMGGKKPGVE